MYKLEIGVKKNNVFNVKSSEVLPEDEAIARLKTVIPDLGDTREKELRLMEIFEGYCRKGEIMGVYGSKKYFTIFKVDD